MKNLLKKSAIQADRNQSTFNESRSYLFSKHSDNHSVHYIHSRKPSQISEVNKSVRNEKTERKTKGKISFNYKKDKNEPPGFINNYHTTNYIVEKYIVQPQEMNIILRDGHNQSRPISNQPVYRNNNNARYFDLSEEFEQYEGHKESPKWTNQPYSFVPQVNTFKSPRNSHQNGGNNCHFSFGHHQKNTFMSKYMNMGMKQVQSKRHSQNSKESMPRPSLEIQKFKADQLNRYNQEDYTLMKNSFKRTNFSHFQQKQFNIIDSEEYESESSSQNSEVIDSYQSIMKRMSQSPYHTQKYAD